MMASRLTPSSSQSFIFGFPLSLGLTPMNLTVSLFKSEVGDMLSFRDFRKFVLSLLQVNNKIFLVQYGVILIIRNPRRSSTCSQGNLPTTSSLLVITTRSSHFTVTSTFHYLQPLQHVRSSQTGTSKLGLLFTRTLRSLHGVES